MRLIVRAVAMLLALAWVPLTSHCLLEAMPGLEFVRCCADAEGSPAEGGGDRCGDDGCCEIESAKYQSSRHQNVFPVVLVALLPEESLPLLGRLDAPTAVPGIPAVAPPELPASWRFAFRTALPVRAPSLAS